jgi:GNAT superfamily N-acetyltransferase
MVVREFFDNELEKLLTLYTALNNNPYPEVDERILRVWRKMMEDPDHHVIGVFDHERAVSSCVLVIIPNLTHRQHPYAVIENVVTAENERRKGYAAASLSLARDIAVKAGCYKIMLMSGSKKEETMRFYESNGYNRKDKTAFIQWL